MHARVPPALWLLALGGLLATLSGSSALFAQAQTRRGTLIDVYLDDAQSRHQIYESAPVSHIVPEFNTITYALAADYRDVKVQPQDLGMGMASQNIDEALELGGYTVSPYLALSLKRIGLGFSAETGQRTASYHYGSTPDSWQTSQQSTMEFKSVGAFLYLIPFPSLPKAVTATIILGGRNYNAKHQVSGDQWSENQTRSSAKDLRTYRYNINRYEAGLNVGLKLLKNFYIIPWVDYVVTDAKAASLLAQSGNDGGVQYPGSQARNFEQDLELFWDDAPRLQYGIDFAVRLWSLEIHFGDAFGAVAAFDKYGEQIEDRTLTLSVALTQKAPR